MREIIAHPPPNPEPLAARKCASVSRVDGLSTDVFDKTLIDNLVIRYLSNFLQAPNLDVTDHWHAIHAHHPENPYLVSQPGQDVRVVTALGGSDMTLRLRASAAGFGRDGDLELPPRTARYFAEARNFAASPGKPKAA